MEPSNADINEAVTLLRKDFDEGKKSRLTQEEKDKVIAALDSQEATNQKMVLVEKRADNLQEAIEAAQERIEKMTTEAVSADDLKNEITAMEALIAQRPGNEGDSKAWKDSPEFKALSAWAQRPDQLSADQKAEMRTDVDTAGGFLAPTEFDTALLKEIVEIDAIRSLARVRTIASKAVEMAVRTDIPRGFYEGEAEQNQEDIGTYRLVTVVPHRQSLTIPSTLDLLMNGAFDMESELLGDGAEGFAEGEGINFVSGSGNKTPEGVTQNPTVIANMSLQDNLSAVDTSVDATMANAIINITGKLKVGYNAGYNFHRRTLARIRTLRDTNAQFLWQPGLNGPVSNTLNGFPYVLTPSLDPWDTATGDIMIFGDWARGYTIVDRTGLSIVRDEVTEARKAIVKFTMHRWNTGIVTIPEAFQMMRRNA